MGMDGRACQGAHIEDEGAVVEDVGRELSLSEVEQPSSLTLISDKHRGIQASLDFMDKHQHEDIINYAVYFSDPQTSQVEILRALSSLH